MKRTKRNMRNDEPMTPEEALSLLESAVSYCQAAGLKVAATNSDNGTLGLFVPNAHYVLMDNGTRAAFRLGTAPKELAERIGTHGMPAHG